VSLGTFGTSCESGIVPAQEAADVQQVLWISYLSLYAQPASWDCSTRTVPYGHENMQATYGRLADCAADGFAGLKSLERWGGTSGNSLAVPPKLAQIGLRRQQPTPQPFPAAKSQRTGLPVG